MNNEPVAWMSNGKEFYVQKNYCPDFIPLYTHPAKELHLSLQKVKDTGELLAVTYTDDEHKIVEVLWQRPPVKELTDEEIHQVILNLPNKDLDLIDFARAILKKASEK